MKIILQLILICLTVDCLAQPTGHQKIFLEISDNGDTLHFENSFKKNEHGWKTSLTYQTYELNDISHNQTGFEYYPRAKYLHKTLMTDDHHIQIVKNKTDTMNIEILNAFNVYFLNIPFQKGNFKLYIDHENKEQWIDYALPYKQVTSEQIVYDITPLNWNSLQIILNKPNYEYRISMQYEKKNLFLRPIIPEDNPNFRNLYRVNKLRMEVADYNYDGKKDFREQITRDTTKWNYFIYKDSIQGYVLDSLLSNIDICYFDFEKKSFIGSKTTRINSELTQMDYYEYIERRATLIRQVQCVHAFSNSEKMDCSYYVLQNGKMVFEKLIKGAE